MSTVGSNKGSTTPAPPATGTLHKELKVPTPDNYHGERSKLKHFLIQVELYMGFNSTRFASDTEKVLWVVTLLRGVALNWIEGFVQDYLKNHVDGKVSTGMSQDTVQIFQTFRGFRTRLEKVFGEVDEEKLAEREIQTLRQRGSAARYTADFQRYSVKTGWNDEALKAQYYRGLKDVVKDDLVREDKPDKLAELIRSAIQIDNRHYERAMEKQGFYDTSFRKQRNGLQGSYGQSSRNNSQWPQPMELDATERTRLSSQEKQKRIEGRLCFQCGKPGHMARSCGKQRNVGRKRELNALAIGRQGRMMLNATSLGKAFDSEMSMTYGTTAQGEWVERNGSDSQETMSLEEDIALEENPELEGVTQSLQAFNFVDTLGNDVKSDSENELSDDEDISSYERMILQVLGGHKTTEELHAQAKREYWDDINTTQRGRSSGAKFRQGELAYMIRYQCHLKSLIEATERQQQEVGIYADLGTYRSQQYQDRFAQNKEYLTTLEKDLKDMERETDKNLEDRRKRYERNVQRHIQTVERSEENNIARIDHPQHGQLAWSNCYHDHCITHESAKRGSNYWPKQRKAVYWTCMPTTDDDEVATPATKESKN